MEKQDYPKESNSEEDNIRIMQQLIPVAESYGRYLRSLLGQGNIKGLATILLNYTDVLVDAARKMMEGKGTELKPKVSHLIIDELSKAIEKMMQKENEVERQDILSELSGWMVANQVFNEGNNRAYYFLLIMLGVLSNTHIPGPDIFKRIHTLLQLMNLRKGN